MQFPGSLKSDPSNAYDPNAAKELLAQSAYKGEEITYLYASDVTVQGLQLQLLAQSIQADLKAFAAGDTIQADDGPGTTVFVERCYPKPVIAAVNGSAVAGGFGIMLGCDLVVAADHAVFGLPEVKRGLVGVGATSRAALRLPPQVTLELALTGEPIDAATALHHGLVNRVVPKERVLPEAIALAESIAAKSLPSIIAAKAALDAAMETTLAVGLDIEREAFASLFDTVDQKEGMAAFREKRPPQFVNR